MKSGGFTGKIKESHTSASPINHQKDKQQKVDFYSRKDVYCKRESGFVKDSKQAPEFIINAKRRDHRLSLALG